MAHYMTLSINLNISVGSDDVEIDSILDLGVLFDDGSLKKLSSLVK